MIKDFITIICLIALLITTQAKLYQVVSQFRHGARYALNNYYDGSFSAELHGELSAVGMRQHETLGKMLRRDYIEKLGFLSDQYKEGQIQVYTTNINRTFQSVRSQLYGLYPLGQGQKMPTVDSSYHLPPYSNNSDSSEQLFALPEGYRTIPVYVNEDIDLTDCANIKKEQEKNINYQIETYREMNLTYYPFLKRMASVFNISMNNMNFSVLSSIYDTLTVDRFLGRPMPKQNFTEDDYANMKHLHLWFNFFKNKNELSRAVNTGKIKKILADFDDRLNNVNNKTLKWTFISSHDTDATTMMYGLNFSTPQCIQQIYRRGETYELNCSPDQQYATNLIFQLHSDNGKDFYVKIRHDGNYLYLCEKKDTSCPYQQWKQRVQRIIINVDYICNGPQYKLNNFQEGLK